MLHNTTLETETYYQVIFILMHSMATYPISIHHPSFWYARIRVATNNNNNIIICLDGGCRLSSSLSLEFFSRHDILSVWLEFTFNLQFHIIIMTIIIIVSTITIYIIHILSLHGLDSRMRFSFHSDLFVESILLFPHTTALWHFSVFSFVIFFFFYERTQSQRLNGTVE